LQALQSEAGRPTQSLSKYGTRAHEFTTLSGFAPFKWGWAITPFPNAETPVGPVDACAEKM
jgi:hypothetical protein